MATEPSRLTVRDITTWFADRHAGDYERKVTTKWIGGILRRRLHLRTEKSHGTYILGESEGPHVRQLFERYGVDPEAPSQAREDYEKPIQGDFGDVGDVQGGSGTTDRGTAAG